MSLIMQLANVDEYYVGDAIEVDGRRGTVVLVLLDSYAILVSYHV